MSRPRSRPPEMLADTLGPEDGHDPKRDHDRRTWDERKKGGRKAQQLCEQVADALRTILAGLADEVLQNLTVLTVAPAPHTGRLLVTVAGPAPADATDRPAVSDVLSALSKAAGRIRSEVATYNPPPVRTGVDVRRDLTPPTRPPWHAPRGLFSFARRLRLVCCCEHHFGRRP